MDYLVKLSEAKHKALLAKIVYEGLKKEQDLLRTYEATSRCVHMRRCFVATGCYCRCYRC
jgi:hypothetical protein